MGLFEIVHGDFPAVSDNGPDSLGIRASEDDIPPTLILLAATGVHQLIIFPIA
jgi:hypothetical protein